VETFSKKDGVVRTKRTWLFVAAMVVMLAGFTPMLYSVLAAVFGGHYAAAALGLIAYYGGTFALMYLWNTRPNERRGRLRADESGLRIDDELVIARAAIRNGHLLDAKRVRLGRLLRPVDVVVEDEDEANALLHAMRLDAARSVGSYPMNHGTVRQSWINAVIVFIVAAVGTTTAVVTLTPSIVIGWSALFGLGAVSWALNQFVRVAVGADGVRVGRLLARNEFIPFAAFESAETDGRDVTFRLKSGRTIAMHLAGGKRRDKVHVFVDRTEDARLLVARINEQIASHRNAPTDAALLVRGERDARTWMRAVVGTSDEHASFRVPAFPAEDLWRVVEDPAAATTARAAAALALQSQLDDDGRARLRVAADACASPKLRVALEATASTNDTADLEDAFEGLEDVHSDRIGLSRRATPESR